MGQRLWAHLARWGTRWRGTVAVLIGTVLLAACSLVQTIYNQSPELVLWWLDDYADFPAQQSEQVKADLRKLHAWHRAQQLPLYAEWLRRMQTLAQSDVTPEQVCAVVQEARGSLPALLGQIEPMATRLALSMHARQIKALQKQYERTNRKWRAEWMEGTPEKLLAFRVDKGMEHSTRFYGKLEPAQQQLLTQLASDSPYTPELTYRERLRRQQDIVDMLRSWETQAITPAAAHEDVRKLLARSVLASPDANYRDYAEAQLAYNCQAVAKLHNTTTPAQRARAVKTLRGYENDVRALIAHK